MPSRGHSGNVVSGSRNVKMNLKLGTWNIRTLQDPSTNDGNRPPRRTAIVANELRRYDIDIAALSETRLPDEDSITEVGEGYTFFWKGLPKESPRIHGVGFAIKTSLLAKLPEGPTGINERLMTWRIPLIKRSLPYHYQRLCSNSSRRGRDQGQLLQCT